MRVWKTSAKSGPADWRPACVLGSGLRLQGRTRQEASLGGHPLKEGSEQGHPNTGQKMLGLGAAGRPRPGDGERARGEPAGPGCESTGRVQVGGATGVVPRVAALTFGEIGEAVERDGVERPECAKPRAAATGQSRQD